MTQKQLHLLKILAEDVVQNHGHIDWKIEGLSEDEREELQELGMLIVDVGEGFMGQVITLGITEKGKEFIETFCSICECMPCDCDWGQP